MDTDLEIWFRGALLDLVLGAHYNLCKQQGKQVLAVDLACPPPVHDALLPQLARNASKVTGPSTGSRTYMGERISSTVWSFGKAEALQFFSAPQTAVLPGYRFGTRAMVTTLGTATLPLGALLP